MGFAAVDPSPDVPPRELEMDTALCPHGMTLGPRETFIIPDASKDWRFARNASSDITPATSAH